MLSYIIFFISWLLLVRLLVYTKSKVSGQYFYTLLLIKISCGIFSGVLYHYYYKFGDVLNVQRDAVFLSKLSIESFTDYFLFLFDRGINYEQILHQVFYEGEPRTLFFVKLISLVNRCCLNNFWLCSVFISVLGFCAIIYGIEHISKFYKIRKESLKIAFLLVPSVGIWTSGIMKEAIVIPVLVFAVSIFMVKPNVFKYVLSFVLLYIAFVLKYYFVVPFVVFMMFSIILKRTGANIWLLAVGVVVSFLSMALHPNLNFNNFYEAVLASNNLTMDRSYAINSIDFSSLGNAWYWLIVYLPKAWYYGLFSPLPWQAYSDLSYLQSVQSFFFLVLVSWTVYRFIKLKFKLSLQPVLCVLYVLFMAGLLPLCSPNIGSLSRYSVIYIPVLITLCVEFYYEQKDRSPS